MTLQQEAYSRIDQMTDDGIRVLIDIIDKMKTVSVIGFKDNKVAVSNSPIDTAISKERKKTGKMNYHSSPSRLSRSKSHKEAKPKPKNQTAKAHDPNKKPKMGNIQK